MLRRQIAVYRHALKHVENLELWERYEKSLDEALRELEVLKGLNLRTKLSDTPIERLRKLVESGGLPAAASRPTKSPTSRREG